jgi:hypothetical protein
MADIPTDALLNVLRRAAQVEDGLEDAPLEEGAARQCQRLGWLNNEMQLTPAGREVLETNKGPKQS